MNIKKYLPMIFAAVIGILLSTKYAIIVIGVLIVISIIYRKYIPEIIEAFTETEFRKIESILLIGIIGFTMIIESTVNNFMTAMLIFAWMIFMVLLVLKLSMLNLHQQFELERKEIDLRYSIPLKEHRRRLKRLEEIYHGKPDTS